MIRLKAVVGISGIVGELWADAKRLEFGNRGIGLNVVFRAIRRREPEQLDGLVFVPVLQCRFTGKEIGLA
jgi:hypothetical protein